MPAQRQTKKSKVMSDLHDDLSQAWERQGEEPIEEDDNNFIGVTQQASSKKKKTDPHTEIECLTERFLEDFKQQHQKMSQCYEKLWRDFSDIASQIQADYCAIKDNEQKLQKLTGSFMKCLEQATESCKEQFDAIRNVETLKEQLEEMESRHKQEIDKFFKNLQADVVKLQNKIFKENRKREIDNLRRNIDNMMQNEILDI